MKIHAIHDAKGNITRIVVSPPNAPPGLPSAPAGHSITEVETDIGLDLKDPASFNRLADVLKNFQVERKTSAKLVKKTGPKGAWWNAAL
jgi:hypothetical protein